ncbi:MAG: DUF6798 domain-containing protein [Pirellulales bacterium]
MSVAHLNSPAVDIHRDRPRSPARWIAAVEIALIVAVFALQAAWPVPDPNEPHYLGKARHFWDPQWVPDDFFFNSADTHLVFYVSLGWLANWLSLTAFAWTGRFCTWLLLAWSWRRLSYALLPRPGWAVLSAAIFLTLNVCCHMAGEWVVGGFEAKGLAYVLVFLGLAEIVRDRWNAAWLLLGAASSLHVLVGGWSTIAAAICWLTLPARPALRSMLPGLAGGLLFSLPGLAAALAINWGVESEIVAEANTLYVYRRLRHHLVPQSFGAWMLARHLLMILLWLALIRLTPVDPAQRRLRGIVAGAVAIAVLGFVISLVLQNHPTTAAALLRLYWFRLSDSLVPAGVALTAIVYAARQPHQRYKTARWCAGWLVVCAVLAAANHHEYAAARFFGGPPRADKPGKVIDYADWRAACDWATEHTPSDARFLTPRLAQTFKWYAARSEVVSWKDVPQDARAIVEWWRRLNDIHGLHDRVGGQRWHDSLAELSEQRLRRLGRTYRAGYLLTESRPRLDLPRLYHNASYAIYRVE